jgi:preprotein translocase subunit SecF
MKLKRELSHLLRNKWVLNIVSLLALLTVIGYGMMNNLNAVAFFIAIAVLVFYFSKNMIFVLGIPLIVVNLFVYMHVIKEGMETQSSSQMQKAKSSSTPSSTPSPKKKSKYQKPTSQGLPATSVKEEEEDAKKPVDESFEVGRAKQMGGYKIDYASTIEDAYDDLNKILGGGGMKKLTSDTQNLMKQQVQLAEAMKGMEPLIQSMTPLMQQAQGLLGGLKDGDGKGLGGMMEMLKQFSGKQQQMQ